MKNKKKISIIISDWWYDLWNTAFCKMGYHRWVRDPFTPIEDTECWVCGKNKYVNNLNERN